MSRVPLTVRLLVLLPLLAAGVDVTRATAACGAQAQTCLEAAGRGWLGPLAVLLVVLYAAGAGVLLARLVRRGSLARDAVPGFGRLWAVATTGLVTVCTGQELVARLAGGDATLGGTPLGVFALCAVAGALLACVMRAAAAAAELVAGFGLRAPRAPQYAVARVSRPGAEAAPRPQTGNGRVRGRAPPR